MTVICQTRLAPNASFKGADANLRADAIAAELALYADKDGAYLPLAWEGLVDRLKAKYADVEEADVEDAMNILTGGSPPYVDDELDPMFGARTVRLLRPYADAEEGPRTAEWIEDIDQVFTADRDRQLAHAAHILEFAVIRSTVDHRDRSARPGLQAVMDHPRSLVSYVRDTLTAWQNSGRLDSLPGDFVSAVPSDNPTDQEMERFLDWLIAHNEDLGRVVFDTDGQKLYPGLDAVSSQGKERHAWITYTAQTNLNQANDLAGVFMKKGYVEQAGAQSQAGDVSLVQWDHYDGFKPDGVAHLLLEGLRHWRRLLPEAVRNDHDSFPLLAAIAKDLRIAGGLHSMVQLTLAVRQMSRDSQGTLVFRTGKVSYMGDVTRVRHLTGEGRVLSRHGRGTAPIGISPNSMTQLDEIDQHILSAEPRGSVERAQEIGMLPYLGGPVRQMLRGPMAYLKARVTRSFHKEVSQAELDEIARQTDQLQQEGLLPPDMSPQVVAGLYVRAVMLMHLSLTELGKSNLSFNKEAYKRFFPMSNEAKRYLPTQVSAEKTELTRKFLALIAHEMSVLNPPDNIMDVLELVTTGAISDNLKIVSVTDTLPAEAFRMMAVENKKNGDIFSLVEDADEGRLFRFVNPDGTLAIGSDGKPRNMATEPDFKMVATISPTFDIVGWLRANNAMFDKTYEAVHRVYMGTVIESYFQEQANFAAALFDDANPPDVDSLGTRKFTALKVADNLAQMIYGKGLWELLTDAGNSVDQIVDALSLPPTASPMVPLPDTVRGALDENLHGFPIHKVIALKMPDIDRGRFPAHHMLKLDNGVRDSHAFFSMTPVSFGFVADREAVRLEDTMLGKLPGSGSADTGRFATHEELVSEALLGSMHPWVGDYQTLRHFMHRMETLGISVTYAGNVLSYDAMKWSVMLSHLHGALIGMPRLTSNNDQFNRLVSRAANRMVVAQTDPGMEGAYDIQQKAILFSESTMTHSYVHETTHAGLDMALGGRLLTMMTQYDLDRRADRQRERGHFGESATDLHVYDQFFKEKHGQPLDEADVRRLISAMYRMSYIERWTPKPGSTWADVMRDLDIKPEDVQQLARKHLTTMGRTDREAYVEAAEQAIRELMAEHIAPRSLSGLFMNLLRQDHLRLQMSNAEGNQFLQGIRQAVQQGDADTVLDWVNDLIEGRQGLLTDLYWTSLPETLARLAEIAANEMANRNGVAIGRLRTSTHGLFNRDFQGVVREAYTASDDMVGRMHQIYSELMMKLRVEGGRVVSAPLDLSGLAWNNTPDEMVDNEAGRIANEMMETDRVKAPRFKVRDDMATAANGDVQPDPDIMKGSLRTVEEGPTTLLVVWDRPVAVTTTALARKVMDTLRNHPLGPTVRALGKVLRDKEIEFAPELLEELARDVRRFMVDNSEKRSITETEELIKSAPSMPRETQAAAASASANFDPGNTLNFVSYTPLPPSLTMINGESPVPHATGVAMPVMAVHPQEGIVTPIEEMFSNLNPTDEQLDEVVAGWRRAEGVRLAKLLPVDELESRSGIKTLVKHATASTRLSKAVDAADDALTKAKEALDPFLTDISAEEETITDEQAQIAEKEKELADTPDTEQQKRDDLQKDIDKLQKKIAPTLKKIEDIEKKAAPKRAAVEQARKKVSETIDKHAEAVGQYDEAHRAAIEKVAPDLEEKGSEITKERLAELINLDPEAVYSLFYPKGHEHPDAPSVLQVDALVKALSKTGLDPLGRDAWSYPVSDLAQVPVLHRDDKTRTEIDYRSGFLSALGTGAGKTRIIATLYRIRAMVAVKRISLFLATTDMAQTDKNGNRILRYEELSDEQHRFLFDNSPDYKALVTSGVMIDMTGGAKGVIRGFIGALEEADMIDKGAITVDDNNRVEDARNGYISGGKGRNMRLISFRQVDVVGALEKSDYDPVTRRYKRPDYMYPRPGDAIFIDTYEQFTTQNPSSRDRMAHFLYNMREKQMSKLQDTIRRPYPEIEYLLWDPPENMLQLLYLTGVNSFVDWGPPHYDVKDKAPHHDFRDDWVVDPSLRSGDAFKDIRVQWSLDEADTAGNVMTLGTSPDTGTATEFGVLAAQSRGTDLTVSLREPSKRALLTRELVRLFPNSPVMYSTATPMKDADRMIFLERVLQMLNPTNKRITPTVIAGMIRSYPEFRSSLVKRISELGLGSFAMLPIYPHMIRTADYDFQADSDILASIWQPWSYKPSKRYYEDLLDDMPFMDIDVERVFREALKPAGQPRDPDVPHPQSRDNRGPILDQVRQRMTSAVNERQKLVSARMSMIKQLYHQVVMLPKLMDDIERHAANNTSVIVGVDKIGDAFAQRQIILAKVHGEEDLGPRLTIENYFRTNMLQVAPIWRMAPVSVRYVDQSTKRGVKRRGRGRRQGRAIRERELKVIIKPDTLYIGSWKKFLQDLQTADPSAIPDAGLLTGLTSITDDQSDKPVLIVLEADDSGQKVPYIGMRPTKGSGLIGKTRLTPQVMELVARSKGVSADAIDIYVEEGEITFRVVDTEKRDQVLEMLRTEMRGGPEHLLPIVELETSDREITLSDGTKTTFGERFLQLSSMGAHYRKDDQGRILIEDRDHDIERESTIQEFNSDNWHYLIASAPSAARGINLHKTRDSQPDRVTIPLDMGHDNNNASQLMGRQHRAGRAGDIHWDYINSNVGGYQTSQWPMFAKLAEASELTTGSREMMVGRLPPFIDLLNDEARSSVKQAIEGAVEEWIQNPGMYSMPVENAFHKMGLTGNPADAAEPLKAVRSIAGSESATTQKSVLVGRMMLLGLHDQETFVSRVLGRFITAERNRIARMPPQTIPGVVTELGHLYARDDGSGQQQRFSLVEYFRGGRNIFTVPFGDLLHPAPKPEDEDVYESNRIYFREPGGTHWVIDLNRDTKRMQVMQQNNRTREVEHVLVHKFTQSGFYQVRDQWVPKFEIEQIQGDNPTVGSTSQRGDRISRMEMEAVWGQASNHVRDNHFKERAFIYTGDPVTFIDLYQTDFRKVDYKTSDGSKREGYAVSFGIGEGALYLHDKHLAPDASDPMDDAQYQQEHIRPRREAFRKLVDLDALETMDRTLLDRLATNNYERVRDAMLGSGKGQYMLWLDDVGVAITPDTSGAASAQSFIMKQSEERRYMRMEKASWITRPDLREWRMLLADMMGEVSISAEAQLTIFHMMFPHAKIYQVGSPEYKSAMNMIGAVAGTEITDANMPVPPAYTPQNRRVVRNFVPQGDNVEVSLTPQERKALKKRAWLGYEPSETMALSRDDFEQMGRRLEQDLAHRGRQEPDHAVVTGLLEKMRPVRPAVISDPDEVRAWMKDNIPTVLKFGRYGRPIPLRTRLLERELPPGQKWLEETNLWMEHPVIHSLPEGTRVMAHRNISKAYWGLADQNGEQFMVSSIRGMDDLVKVHARSFWLINPGDPELREGGIRQAMRTGQKNVNGLVVGDVYRFDPPKSVGEQLGRSFEISYEPWHGKYFWWKDWHYKDQPVRTRTEWRDLPFDAKSQIMRDSAVEWEDVIAVQATHRGYFAYLRKGRNRRRARLSDEQVAEGMLLPRR